MNEQRCMGCNRVLKEGDSRRRLIATLGMVAGVVALALG